MEGPGLPAGLALMPDHSQHGRNDIETPADRKLAGRFGGYASYNTPNDPFWTDFHGDSPSVEMERLLDLYTSSDSKVLDLGCGAGFTLCRLSAKVREIWGIDLEVDLLAAARERVQHRNLNNVTLVQGDTTDPATVARLPEGHFDFAFSRRGPFLTESLARKLTPDALFVVELAQDSLGLKELFGRNPSLPRSLGDPEWAITHHFSIGYVPVSAKSYWYEDWFRDEDHLAAFLAQGAPLTNWWMHACPYDDVRDRPALELYCRYNRTSEGIRVIGHKRVYVFRCQPTRYYPAEAMRDSP